MIACRLKPHRALSGFVENLWLYDGYVSAHQRERILPSGTFELVLNLCDNELRIYDPAKPGRCRRYSGAVVSGPYAGCFMSDAREEVSIMGVHFKPGGAFPFLGFPAGEMGARTRELARTVGLSERRFIDVFRNEVGMTPKLFDRVQRFQRALGQLSAAASIDWALLAAECGYFDQSHLIRDFREFTGLVPTDYLQRAQTLRALGAHSKPNHLAFAQ